jgi:hypothetical protein
MLCICGSAQGSLGLGNCWKTKTYETVHRQYKRNKEWDKSDITTDYSKTHCLPAYQVIHIV